MGLYSENLKTSPRREYVFAVARQFHKKLLGHGILLAAAEYISSRGNIVSPRREMTIAAATLFYNAYKKSCRMLRHGEV